MSGDLVSLGLLLISAVPSEQNLWREGAALASVPIEFAAAARKKLAKGGIDICKILSGSRFALDINEAEEGIAALNQLAAAISIWCFSTTICPASTASKLCRRSSARLRESRW
jgi:hypothetical protein